MFKNKRDGWLYESCNETVRPVQVKGWGKFSTQEAQGRQNRGSARAVRCAIAWWKSMKHFFLLELFEKAQIQ